MIGHTLFNFNRLTALACVFTLALASAPLFAAPPTATSIYPSGGSRGSSVVVTVTGSFDTWPVSVWSSTPGITVTPEKDKAKFKVTVGKEAPLGVAWLRFHDESGASALRPFIVGGLPETNEVEPNGELKTSQLISLPQVVNGTLAKSGDVDCFKVHLNKGQTLVASVTAHESLRSPIDTIMQLLSANGTVLEQNNDTHGLDSELVYTASAGGDYIVRIFAFPAAPDSSIRYFGSATSVYRLTLTTDEFIDFTTPLSFETGRETKATLSGWNLKSKTVTVGAKETTLGIANLLPIHRVPHACFDVTTTTDKVLTPPFSATGRIAKPHEHSTIRVQGQAGKALAIHLDSANLGFPLTPVLRILDDSGKQLSRSEPAALNGPLDTSYTPKANGPFKIEIHDLLGSASSRHIYQLIVTEPTPALDAKLAADRFTLTVGTPLDIPITLVRKNGFAGDLVPITEGLPEGVTAEITPIPDPKVDKIDAEKKPDAKKDTAKPAKPPAPAKADPNLVSLRLTAKKPGVRGVITIGVERKGTTPFKQWASAPNADFEHPTQQIWLTVIAPAKPAPAPTPPKAPKK